MSAPGMKWAMALSIAVVLAGGCAKGDNFPGTGGSPGEGGEGGSGATGAGPQGGGGAGGGMGGTVSTGGGGAPTTTSTGGDPTTTSTTTTTTTTTGSSMGCGANEHECSGQCVGNTPQSGCLQSVTCTACPVPANGSAACTGDGVCDVNCAVGYMKQGSSCVCATQCCSVADCPAGQTCSGGMCSGGGGGAGGGGTCDDSECQFACTAQCIIMMKFGVGMCSNGMCNCTCI